MVDACRKLDRFRYLGAAPATSRKDLDFPAPSHVAFPSDMLRALTIQVAACHRQGICKTNLRQYKVKMSIGELSSGTLFLQLLLLWARPAAALPHGLSTTARGRASERFLLFCNRVPLRHLIDVVIGFIEPNAATGQPAARDQSGRIAMKDKFYVELIRFCSDIMRLGARAPCDPPLALTLPWFCSGL